MKSNFRVLCRAIPLTLFAATAAFADAAAQFQVGFGTQKIDATKPIPLGGYGVYVGIPSATRTNGVGIHDSLYARVMAVQGASAQGPIVALASLDLVGISSASVARIRQRVAEALPHSPVTVLLSATHTHHSPDTMGLWGALPFFTGRNAEYMEMMEKNTAHAVVDSVKNLSPAKLYVSESEKPNTSTLSENTRHKDDEVTTLWAKNLDGQLLGSFTQWSAHPTILGANNNALSSDFPGAFRHFMEQGYPGTHIYANGMLGASYVIGEKIERADPFQQGAQDPDVGNGYRLVAGVGWDLFSRVQAALPQARPVGEGHSLAAQDEGSSATGAEGTVEVRESQVRIPNQNGLFKWAIQLKIIEKPAMKKEDILTNVSWFRIGDVQGATVPGEMFSSGTAEIRRHFEKTGARSTLILGIGNEWLGYLMSPEDYDNPEFEYQRKLSPHRHAVPLLLKGIKQLSE